MRWICSERGRDDCYIPQILSALRSADLSPYRDSMRPLIEKDIAETEKILTAG